MEIVAVMQASKRISSEYSGVPYRPKWVFVKAVLVFLKSVCLFVIF